MPREPVRLLVFSASLRQDSYNTQLARLAVRLIEELGGGVDAASMADFDCGSYNQDAQSRNGIPPGAAAMRDRLEANDGFVVASPEYNGSMPGLLKNVIDWTSRHRPQPFNALHGLLLSASPSMMGGNRGLWALRVPLEHLGARIYPDMFSLAQADRAFGTDGDLVNAELRKRLRTTLTGFLDLVEAAKHYPCAKKAWIEFLGEQPNAVIDRVE